MSNLGGWSPACGRTSVYYLFNTEISIYDVRHFDFLKIDIISILIL